ncbi:unnamed protein product [Rhodiola kirilowii]
MTKKRPPKKTLFCYCHLGGEISVNADKTVTYEGGRVDGIVIDDTTKFKAFIELICDRLHILRDGNVFKYSVKFDRLRLLPLEDQCGLDNLLQFNDGDGYVYVEQVDVFPDVAATATRGSNTGKLQLSEYQGDEVDYVETSPDIAVRLALASGEGPSELIEFTDGDASGHTSCDRPIALPSQAIMVEWEKEILGVGQQFPDMETFRVALYKYAIAHSFRYTLLRNAKKNCAARCVVKKCPWRLTVLPLKQKCDPSSEVIVRKFIDKHRHSEQDEIDSRPVIRPKYIAGLVAEKIKNNPNMHHREIAKAIESEFALTLKYQQSFRAKQKAMIAINGKVEDTYKLIPWLCQRLMEMMPGTVAAWGSTDSNHFKQLFVAYSCSVRGFQLGCRPLLFVNHIEMYNPYKSIFVTVNALDANDDAFPVAYGCLAAEENNDWLWFFQKLKVSIGDGEFILISDKNDSIRHGIDEVFGAENHAHSYQDLRESFRLFVHESLKLRDTGKETALSLLDDIVYARSGSDHNKALLTMHRYNKELYEWLSTNSVARCANSHFVKKRWDKFDFDCSYNFISWMLNESCMPLLEFMKIHQHKLAELMLTRKAEIPTWEFNIGDKLEMKLRENISRAAGLMISQISEFTFQTCSETIHDVDMATRSCSCLEWQMTGIPCPHACSVLQLAKLEVYDYVEKYFHREAQETIYAEVMPLLDTDDIPKPHQINSLYTDDSLYLLTPTSAKRAAGRPRAKPAEPRKWIKSTNSCSLCLQAGHNKKTCKNVQ